MCVEHFENLARLIAINTTGRLLQRSEHSSGQQEEWLTFVVSRCRRRRVVDLVHLSTSLSDQRPSNSLEMIRAIVRNDLLKLKLVRCVKKELLIDFIDTNIFFTQCCAQRISSFSASLSRGLITLLNCCPQRKEINFYVSRVLWYIFLISFFLDPPHHSCSKKGIVNLTHRVLRISFPLSIHDSFKQYSAALGSLTYALAENNLLHLMHLVYQNKFVSTIRRTRYTYTAGDFRAWCCRFAAALPIKLWDFFAKWMGNDQNLPERELDGTGELAEKKNDIRTSSRLLRTTRETPVRITFQPSSRMISSSRIAAEEAESWLRLPHSFIYHLTYVVFSLFFLFAAKWK